MGRYDIAIAAMQLRQAVGENGGDSLCDRYKTKPQNVETMKIKSSRPNKKKGPSPKKK
jgi:hypothetical protein